MAKTRVGVLIREAMGGKKATAQEGDLVDQTQRFHELQAQVEAFVMALKEHQKAFMRVQDTHVLVAESLAKLSTNTPLDAIFGTAQSDATESVLAMQQRAAAEQNRSKMDAYCPHILEYAEKWQNTLRKRIDEESKTTKQHRIELDHYRRKTEHLRETVQSITAKGKPIPASLQEKLQRNEEKLQTSANAYSISATGLLILLDEANVRYWRDLHHPILMRYAILETEIVMSEAQNLHPLRNAVQAMERIAQQHHIPQQSQTHQIDHRLQQWEHAEPTQISSRQQGMMAELSVIVQETNMDMEIEDDDEEEESEEEVVSAQPPLQATPLHRNPTTTTTTTSPVPRFRVTARPYSGTRGGDDDVQQQQQQQQQHQVHPIPQVQNNASRTHQPTTTTMADLDDDMEILMNDDDSSSSSDESSRDQTPPRRRMEHSTAVKSYREQQQRPEDNHTTATQPPVSLQRYIPTSSTTTTSTTMTDNNNFHIVKIVHPQERISTSPPMYGSSSSSNMRNDPETYGRHRNEEEAEENEYIHEDTPIEMGVTTPTTDDSMRSPPMVIPANTQTRSSSPPPLQDVTMEVDDESHPKQTTSSNDTNNTTTFTLESQRRMMLSTTEDPERALSLLPPTLERMPPSSPVEAQAFQQPSPERTQSPPQPQQRRRIPVDP
jgi:hypothetical protein